MQGPAWVWDLEGHIGMPILSPHTPHPTPRPEPRPHQAVHRPVVGGRGEDDHVQAVDEEVEVEDTLDKSVPLVLQESVQRLHQEHVMAILREAKRDEAYSSPGTTPSLHQPKALLTPTSLHRTHHDHALGPQSH